MIFLVNDSNAGLLSINDSNAGLLGGLDNPGFNSTEYEEHQDGYDPDNDFDTSYENDEEESDKVLEKVTEAEANFSRNMLLKSFGEEVTIETKEILLMMMMLQKLI